MKRFLTIIAATSLLPSLAFAQISQLQASYDFLVKERSAGGALLTFSTATGDYLLPSSYYDTPAYWGAYVCPQSGTSCAVTDTYDVFNYQLSPAPGPAGQMQVERVNAHNSANIYDAATWQIAVVLGYVKGKLRLSSRTSAYALASSLSEVLQQSGLPPKGVEWPGTKRAVTNGKTFVYNGTVIKEGARAYAFRAMAPEWLARDPFMKSEYASLVTASTLPFFNPDYEVGKISWTDWKPITGENAWAFLIGPLQTAHIHYITFLNDTFVPFKELAVQNALDVLPTFAAMQSEQGGIYYAPSGSVGNEGDALVNPYDVSVENNFSLYAGLQILRATLRAELDNEATLTDAEKTRIKTALLLIDVMMDGGEIGKGPKGKAKQTKGLVSFFKDAAWQDGRFVQGGLANDPKQSSAWVPTTTPQAVDVQTWGIAALGAKQIDTWFGFGASFEAWQQLKTWGAYGVDKTLWGVGYSDQDGNGIDADGAYRQGVMSVEWTAGAITALRNMIATYEAEELSSPNYGAAQDFAAFLREDEAAMLKAIGTLRIDQYTATDMPGKPADYADLISIKTKPYLYASKRHHIPFGWYANPLPSTASTAWIIMVANRYDPFGVGGVPN